MLWDPLNMAAFGEMPRELPNMAILKGTLRVLLNMAIYEGCCMRSRTWQCLKEC
jgi:hypothetical protein